jgi:membrane protease YdiL (CAAX protease family)
MQIRNKCNTRAALAFTTVFLVASHWILALANTGYVSRVAATAVVLMAERLVAPSAPSPFGWVHWRVSLRHFGRVAAIAGVVAVLILMATLAIVRLFGLLPAIEPKNIHNASDFPKWVWFGVIQAPIVEEWVYRGVLQPRLRTLVGPGLAIAACGLLFWIGHWFSSGVVTLPHQLLAGLLFSWSWQRTGSLVAPTLLHALNNMVLGCVDILILEYPEFVARIVGH